MGRQVKRVPLDWKWPIGKRWTGYLNPYYDMAKKCEPCDGTGYSPDGKRISDEWYGSDAEFDPRSTGSSPFLPDNPIILAIAKRNTERAPEFYGDGARAIAREANRLCGHFNKGWSHHLAQVDVDVLIEAGRLQVFTHRPLNAEQAATLAKQKAEGGSGYWMKEPNGYHPTAREVNEWSLQGMGHDAINQCVCVRARCEREGVSLACGICDGNGTIWPNPEDESLCEEWEKTEPPSGEGWCVFETVSEGSPISPVFATPEELARWLVPNRKGTVDDGTTYDQWMAFLKVGWAMSGMVLPDGKGLRTGVQAISDQ